MKKIAKILGLDEAATEEQILEALADRPDLSKVAEALSLKADATEDEVLEAVKTAKEEKDEETTEDLDALAAKEGKKVLSNEAVAVMEADAKAGREANDKLIQAEFDKAFDAALKDPKGARVDAKDETRAKYQKLYDKAPEETIEILDALPPIVNGEGRGATGDADELPEGADAERHELNKRAKARMAEKGEDYVTALDAVIAEEQNK